MCKVADIEQIVKKHEAEIMAIPGVTGIGADHMERAIKIYVEHMTPELKLRIPIELEGHPVITEATGKFRAF